MKINYILVFSFVKEAGNDTDWFYCNAYHPFRHH